MKKTDTLFIGLMLFSMFFGAGNLIFPPLLGAQSGTSFWLAMAGFIVTGVGLPLAVLFAMSLVKNGAQEMTSRVHPIFATVFVTVVYLCIGPFLAIPRNANVAFEMGVAPLLKDGSNMTAALLIFSIVFFALVFVVGLNPDKMEKYMGRFITPVLLIAMVVLCGVAMLRLTGTAQAPEAAYKTGAFTKGFLEGYNTMDALAALAFGIVILAAIRKKGVSSEKQMRASILKSSLVAGVLLGLVYVFVGLIGLKMPGAGNMENGTEILAAVANQLFGSAGTLLLGLIFTLACFTTVVGLTTACGHYFSQLIPKASYKMVVGIVALVGLTLSNLGLNQILKVSVPFLVTAYPLTIMLVLLTFFNRYFRKPRKVYATTIVLTGVFAVMSGLSAAGLDLGALQVLQHKMPLSTYGLEWVVPALVGVLAGFVWDRLSSKPVKEQKLDAQEALHSQAL